jgi:hypothetical protein
MPARLNLGLLLELEKRLSAAKAVRAAFRMDIDISQFLALDRIADRLDAAELTGLAAERGGPPPPDSGAERLAFDPC